MTTFIKPHLNQPVTGSDDLYNYLLRGAKPMDEWGIGLEVESIPIVTATGEAAPFAAIETLLNRMSACTGWPVVREKNHVIALNGGHSSITLEPGGQLELSGRLCRDLHCSNHNFSHHLQDLLHHANDLGLTFLGLGSQPFTPLNEINWIPKVRYDIMGPYMQRSGDMGQRMMKQTAGMQVNLDFSDAEDCFEKLRLALAVAPLLYALFANSPLLDGKPSGFLSVRGEIWRRTDPDRTGWIPSLFREGASLKDYIEYALDVPMYFIQRQERLIDLTRERFSFRRFLSEGAAGETPLLGDWDLHLSTIFTEARLRPQVEVRSTDSLPPAMTLAAAALTKAMIYDPSLRQLLWQWLGPLSETERDELLQQSWRLGLRASCGRHTLRDLAAEVLPLARTALNQRNRFNDRGEDETIYLDALEPIISSGKTLAERLLEEWDAAPHDRLAVLKRHCAYSLD